VGAVNDASLVTADRGPLQPDDQEGHGRWPSPVAFGALFVAYTLAALAGLRWATTSGAASPIWPAAGIALSGLLLGGRRLFPAIILGLFAATQLYGVTHPWWSQLLMAAGNAGGALAAAWFIEHHSNGRFARLASVRNVLILIIAACLSGAVSTAVGTAALMAAGRLSLAGLPDAAIMWFFGDAVGTLTIASVILTFSVADRDERPAHRWRPIHLAGALLTVAVLSVLVFFSAPLARAWAVYPALVWVALAFRTRGAALAVLIVSVLASAGTILSFGPFAHSALHPGLLLLQQFLMVTGATTLLLAAAVDERNAESRLRRAAADELAARQELQRTTTLLNLVGDAAPSLIYAKDLAGRYIYVNRALLAMYGKPAAQVLGLTDLDFNPPEQAEVFRANDRRVIESGEAAEVEEQLTLEGRLRTYFSVKAPLRDDRGQIAGIVGISTDVTDRREQQEEVARLARRAEIAQRAARSSLYEYDVASGRVMRDPLMAEVCGIRPGAIESSKEGWERFIHPDDLGEFQRTIAAALGSYERFALEYRVVGDDDRITWVSDAGTIVRDEDGRVRQVIGLVTDVTAQKHADERERLLAREVDHRAKNLLAVVQSVVQLARADDGEQLKRGITGRIQSLARAHSLLADARWEGVDLMGLAREEVAPYAEELDGRVTLHGPSLLLKPAAAQSIALVLHELATNAAKYGALSVQQGRLELSWCIDAKGGLLLVWQERGLTGGRDTAPARTGFGSRLIKASVERQLRGSVDYDWAPQGLTVTMTIAPDYISLGDRASAPLPAG